MQSTKYLSCMAGLPNYNDNFLQNKCAWVNQQHELILAANRQGIEKNKTQCKKISLLGRRKALNIPLGNWCYFVTIQKVINKIQDNYKSELFVIESKHQDPNVSTIKTLNGKGSMHTVNQQQIFDLHKSQRNDMPSSPAPVPNYLLY